MSVTEQHWNGADGNPEGGQTFGRGFAIAWQRGPLGRGDYRIDPNGAFVEDVILAAIGRMAFYQNTKFACDRNARALDHLRQALVNLNLRTRDRESRGVH